MKQSERPSYKKWYATNRKRLIAKSVQRNRNRGIEYRREVQKRYAKNHPEKLRAKARRQYHKNPIKFRVFAKEYRKQLREEFILAYGGACACCGEKEHVFLTLEHKNRDGKKHRTQYHCSAQILADLRRRGWPKEDYECLCFNCNRASWELGVCPHRYEV